MVCDITNQQDVIKDVFTACNEIRLSRQRNDFRDHCFGPSGGLCNATLCRCSAALGSRSNRERFRLDCGITG